MQITEPTLSITSADDGSPYCRVDVDYTVRFEPGELGPDANVIVTLRAAGPSASEPSEHANAALELVLADDPIVDDGSGVVQERVRRRVHRQLLDVDQDWWSSGEDGEPQAIAEFEDRLVAQVEVRRTVTVAAARTNVFVGSFGPLAQDG